MTSISERLREDVRKEPGELERETDRARSDVERTLEALEQRLSPRQLVDVTLNAVRENGGQFGRNLAVQVRNNPMPTILTGLGFAWLMSASSRPPVDHDGGRSLGDRVSSSASTARGAARHAAGTARHAAGTARSAARGAQSAAHGVAGAARGAVSGVGGLSLSSARRLRGGYDYMRHEQPLVLGALAVAAGAAIGAMLPSTDVEDEWLGEASDDAVDRLRDEGEQRVEEAKDAAADAAEAAKGAVGAGDGNGRAGDGASPGAGAAGPAPATGATDRRPETGLPGGGSSGAPSQR